MRGRKSPLPGFPSHGVPWNAIATPTPTCPVKDPLVYKTFRKTLNKFPTRGNAFIMEALNERLPLLVFKKYEFVIFVIVVKSEIRIFWRMGWTINLRPRKVSATVAYQPAPPCRTTSHGCCSASNAFTPQARQRKGSGRHNSVCASMHGAAVGLKGSAADEQGNSGDPHEGQRTATD